MDRYIKSRTYSIKPRMKTYWFKKDKKVYDVIEYTRGEYWGDPSYGNGGGNYIPYENEHVVYTFDVLAEAEIFRDELLNIELCR